MTLFAYSDLLLFTKEDEPGRCNVLRNPLYLQSVKLQEGMHEPKVPASPPRLPRGLLLWVAWMLRVGPALWPLSRQLSVGHLSMRGQVLPWAGGLSDIGIPLGWQASMDTLSFAGRFLFQRCFREVMEWSGKRALASDRPVFKSRPCPSLPV